jgi:hypothetical protein
LGCLVAIANAATVSPVQSTATPAGLTIIAKVDVGGSDTQSQAVQALIPGYRGEPQSIGSAAVVFHFGLRTTGLLFV